MCWNGSGETDHHLSGAAHRSAGRKANPCGAGGAARVPELRSSHADCCRTSKGGSQCRHGHSPVPRRTALIRCAPTHALPVTHLCRKDTIYAPCACSPLGKVWKVSHPYVSPNTPVYTIYTYDGLGRTVSVQLPDGASTT